MLAKIIGSIPVNRNTNKTVLVTGAGGYIGGQVGLELKDHGYTVVGVDRRRRPISRAWSSTIESSFDNDQILDFVAECRPDIIVHCAGTSLVGPSMTDPADYYENNVARSIRLLEVVCKYQPEAHFIFASSAATYGNPDPAVVPLREDGPTVPISPYGWSKLMIEQVLADYSQAYGLKYTAFRFFNVCGADPGGMHGQEKAATHIISRYLESLINEKEFIINGNDFATPDGTCVRDYIHVADIASAIRVAIEEEIRGVYNVGTNHGASNLEVVRTAEQVTGAKWPPKFGPHRLGDPALLTACADKLMQDSSWRPRYSLYEMIEHAWKWYQRDVV